MGRTTRRLAKHRSPAVVVLSFLVAGLVSPAAEAAVRASLGLGQVTHDEGAPCSDPDGASHPCGPACACTCCGRHVQAQTVAAVEVPFTEPPPAEAIPYSADLLPRDVCFRVFHPPRF